MKYSLLALLLCQLLQPVAWAADTMHAMVVTDGKLRAESVAIPEPQSGQVRIHVRAASVNPVDWKLAERAAPGSHAIPGRDLAGVIDAVGPDAGMWHTGQAVIAIATGRRVCRIRHRVHPRRRPQAPSYVIRGSCRHSRRRGDRLAGNGDRVQCAGGTARADSRRRGWRGVLGGPDRQGARRVCDRDGFSEPQCVAAFAGRRSNHRLPQRALRGCPQEPGCRVEHGGRGHHSPLDSQWSNPGACWFPSWAHRPPRSVRLPRSAAASPVQ